MKYLPSLLLSAFLVRLLITGADIGEAIVITALSCLYGGFMYLEHSKQPTPNKDIYDKISDLEDQLKGTKDKLNSVSLASSLKR